MLKFLAITILVLTVSAPVLAADNPELSQLYEKDQAARKQKPIDWTVVGKQDEEHRQRVLEILKGQQVVSANDYLHAAMIMQHGSTFEDIRLAMSLATIASTIDPELKRARWLTAAAWDRALMEKNVPQWYGTQYKSVPGAKTILYKIDESVVTDEERKSLGVPSLQDAKNFLKQINGER
jgi:hypothetical protein